MHEVYKFVFWNWLRYGPFRFGRGWRAKYIEERRMRRPELN